MTNATDKYKKAYSDFIETVSNNPVDLQACQEAFDGLATAYVINSGALNDLTKCNHWVYVMISYMANDRRA